MIGSVVRPRRRSYASLACWYGAALLPAGLLALAERFSDPAADVGYDGRAHPCTAANNCFATLPDGGQLLTGMAVFLAASLVIALPLRAYLVRAWQLPILAGTVAAVTAWFTTAVLYCVGLALMSR